MPLVNTNTDSFGARMRASRRARGMSQAELAAVLRTDQTTVSKYETDQIDPVARARQIADALGVRFSDLVPECGGEAA